MTASTAIARDFRFVSYHTPLSGVRDSILRIAAPWTAGSHDRGVVLRLAGKLQPNDSALAKGYHFEGDARPPGWVCPERRYAAREQLRGVRRMTQGLAVDTGDQFVGLEHYICERGTGRGLHLRHGAPDGWGRSRTGALPGARLASTVAGTL